MHVTPENAVYLFAIGAGSGIAGAILGTGGGVFLIPVLVLVFGLPMHLAVGTSILCVIATSMRRCFGKRGAWYGQYAAGNDARNWYVPGCN